MSEQNSPVEMERKFLISQSTFNRFCEEFESQGGEITKHHIIQHYLFKDNASVKYNPEKNQWKVKLKSKNKKKKFRFNENEHPELANELFANFAGDNLIKKVKCASRIRVLDGEPIFTFKKPIEEQEGDHEFERSVKDVLSGDEFFEDFLKNDPYKVEKNRTVVKRDGFDYEIDDFVNVDLSKQNTELDLSIFNGEALFLLEIEFKDEDEYANYMPDFTSIEVTNIKGFGNKKMALKNGEEALKKGKKSRNTM